MPGLFITGTDTNIGKTYSSLTICQHFKNKGMSIAYYKPLQTGQDSDMKFIKESLDIDCHNSYHLSIPATPQLAFAEDNVTFDPNKIINDYNSLQTQYDIVVVEGAGGLFVPIAPKYTVADMVASLGLPALLISANKLGTINHTALSIKYAQSLNINLLGFAFSGINRNSETVDKVAQTNADIIQQHTNMYFFGCLPHSQSPKTNSFNFQELENKLAISSV